LASLFRPDPAGERHVAGARVLGVEKPFPQPEINKSLNYMQTETEFGQFCDIYATDH
jgi:hypothetical protein